MKTARTLLALTFLIGGAVAAGAADYREAIVSAPADSVWLGHFSGGRNLAPGAEPIPLDWVDVKQNFDSLRDCAAWQKDVKRAYSTYEGWKTCVRIR